MPPVARSLRLTCQMAKGEIYAKKTRLAKRSEKCTNPNRNRQSYLLCAQCQCEMQNAKCNNRESNAGGRNTHITRIHRRRRDSDNINKNCQANHRRQSHSSGPRIAVYKPSPTAEHTLVMPSAPGTAIKVVEGGGKDGGVHIKKYHKR